LPRFLPAVIYWEYQKNKYRKSLPAADELGLDAIDPDRLRDMAAKYPSTVKKRLPRIN
jgi:hypothetical protein